MRLSRITSTLGALALGTVLAATTYGAQARSPAPAGRPQHVRLAARTDHFQAPMPHRYGSNGMRMGLHCETRDMS
jgi:hypothetical protein